MYIFKAANIFWDHPFGLNLDCLALFLGCICEALFLQQEVMNLYDYMYIWIKVCHLFFHILNPWGLKKCIFMIFLFSYMHLGLKIY